jgi:hypothetical protein
LRSVRVNFHSKGFGDLRIAAAEAEVVLFEGVEVVEVVGLERHA